MAKYNILISSIAEKTLKRLPQKALSKLIPAIQALAVDPRPLGCRKMRGEKDVYRIRIGIYRVIYEIEDKKLLILVLKVGHRKDIYR